MSSVKDAFDYSGLIAYGPTLRSLLRDIDRSKSTLADVQKSLDDFVNRLSDTDAKSSELKDLVNLRDSYYNDVEGSIYWIENYLRLVQQSVNRLSRLKD